MLRCCARPDGFRVQRTLEENAFLHLKVGILSRDCATRFPLAVFALYALAPECFHLELANLQA